MVHYSIKVKVFSLIFGTWSKVRYMPITEYYYQQDEQYSMESGSMPANQAQYEGTTSFSGGGGVRGQDQPPDQHLHILPDGRGARCVTCNTLFKTVHTARQHIKLRHGPQEWYECSICKAVIRSRLYFSQHISKRHFKGGTQVVESYGKLVPPPPSK